MNQLRIHRVLMHKMIGVQSIVICIHITDYVNTQKIHKTSQNHAHRRPECLVANGFLLLYSRFCLWHIFIYLNAKMSKISKYVIYYLGCRIMFPYSSHVRCFLPLH